MFGLGIICGVIICYIVFWVLVLNSVVLFFSVLWVNCIFIQCVMLCMLEQMLLVLVLLDQVSGVIVCSVVKLYLVCFMVVLLFGCRWLVLQCVLVMLIGVKMCCCRKFVQDCLDICLIICWVIVQRMLLYVQWLWNLVFSGILVRCCIIFWLVQVVVGQNSRLLVLRFSLLWCESRLWMCILLVMYGLDMWKLGRWLIIWLFIFSLFCLVSRFSEVVVKVLVLDVIVNSVLVCIGVGLFSLCIL